VSRQERTRLCKQCWRPRPLSAFFSERSQRHVVMCDTCRAKYGNWTARTPQQRLATHPPMQCPELVGHRVIMRRSHNRKTGNLVVSMTDRSSCPLSCPLYNRGCFAEFHWMRKHWLGIPATGMPWDRFCSQVAALPPGSAWRHNEAGDLPGKGDEVDLRALGLLVEANTGRRGFTYTHKPMTPALRTALRSARRAGFAVAVSTLGLRAADGAAKLWGLPAVAVVPDSLPVARRTPAGRRVVVCNGGHGTTCERCGLCAQPDRDVVVAFRAHGQWKGLVSNLAGAITSHLWVDPVVPTEVNS
jgi:hypothetical protein